MLKIKQNILPLNTFPLFSAMSMKITDMSKA